MPRLTRRNRVERDSPGYAHASAVEQIRLHPYMSPMALVQVIIDEDPELSLYAVRPTLPAVTTGS